MSLGLLRGLAPSRSTFAAVVALCILAPTDARRFLTDRRESVLRYGGLPVLAADLGGISELLNKAAGRLFSPADEKDLAEKMLWLMDNQDKLAIFKDAGRFNLENYIKNLENLIIPHT